MAGKTKYAIEECISFVASHFLLFTPDKLKDNKALIQDREYHHYFILRRPRVLLDELNIYRSAVQYVFEVDNHTVILEQKRELGFKQDTDLYQYEITNKGASFIIYRNGFVQSYGKSSFLFIELQRDTTQKKYMDFEVLYIGQSYRSNDRYDTFNRLCNHSKLQEILSEVTASSFTDEIFLLLVEFDLLPYYISATGFPTKKSEYGLEDSLKQMNKRRISPISTEQKVTLIEAAMIRKFRPKYNVEYFSFPQKKHTSYNEAYGQDLLSVGFEMNLKSIGVKLFSSTVTPSSIIITQIPLHPDSERINIFNLDGLS